MRSVLVGEVRTAEHALSGLLDAALPPALIVTTDVDAARRRSGMAPEYYANLVALGREYGIATRVVGDLSEASHCLAELAPEVIFVMGWPHLVRGDVLSLAPCIGMHPTRLPRRRGGAPLNWSILDGEPSSAVSLLRLRRGVDDGELLAQRDFPIGSQDYVAEALARVYEITRQLVAEAAVMLAAGRAHWVEQDHALATYTRRRRPEDGRVGWNDSATRIRNLVRATSRPFPGAFTGLDGRRLRIWRCDVPTGYRAPLKMAPGVVLAVGDRSVLVSTRDNALAITEGQLDDGPLLQGPTLADALRSAVGLTLR